MRREPMTATITHVTHDLAKKQTFVGIAWEAERKLFLPIPWEPHWRTSRRKPKALKEHAAENGQNDAENAGTCGRKLLRLGSANRFKIAMTRIENKTNGKGRSGAVARKRCAGSLRTFAT
jgi:hypothetical protein